VAKSLGDNLVVQAIDSVLNAQSAAGLPDVVQCFADDAKKTRQEVQQEVEKTIQPGFAIWTHALAPSHCRTPRSAPLRGSTAPGIGLDASPRAGTIG